MFFPVQADFYLPLLKKEDPALNQNQRPAGMQGGF